MPDPKPTAKRKRGGQAKNDNARKAGFYSNQFSEEELSLIAAFVSDPSLDDELWMARVVNRRLLEYAQATETDEGPNVDMLIRIAEALVKGTGRVASILRDRHMLSGDAADSMAGALGQALEEFGAIIGRDDL